MWNYTKERVLNPGVTFTGSATDLYIQGHVRVKVSQIKDPEGTKKIYKRASNAGDIGTRTVDFTDASITGKILKLTIDLRSIDNVGLEVMRYAMFFGKAQSIEVPVAASYAGADAAAKHEALITDLVTKITAVLKRIPKEIPIAVSKTGTGATAKLVISSGSKFVNVKAVKAFVYDTTLMDFKELVQVTDYDSLTTSTSARRPFGDYDWMVSNVRIRTNSSIAPYTENQDEIPIPGATYSQYIFYIENARTDVTGSSSVGELISSRTTQCYWVNDAISNWETELAKLTGVTLSPIAYI